MTAGFEAASAPAFGAASSSHGFGAASVPGPAPASAGATFTFGNSSAPFGFGSGTQAAQAAQAAAAPASAGANFTSGSGGAPFGGSGGAPVAFGFGAPAAAQATGQAAARAAQAAQEAARAQEVARAQAAAMRQGAPCYERGRAERPTFGSAAAPSRSGGAIGFRAGGAQVGAAAWTLGGCAPAACRVACLGLPAGPSPRPEHRTAQNPPFLKAVPGVPTRRRPAALPPRPRMCATSGRISRRVTCRCPRTSPLRAWSRSTILIQMGGCLRSRLALAGRQCAGRSRSDPAAAPCLARHASYPVPSRRPPLPLCRADPRRPRPAARRRRASTPSTSSSPPTRWRSRPTRCWRRPASALAPLPRPSCSLTSSSLWAWTRAWASSGGRA